MKRSFQYAIFSLLLLFCGVAHNATGVATAQPGRRSESFTREDSLRGMISPTRSCYDVRYYHLDVRVDPDRHTVAGRNRITFTVETPCDSLQLDLFQTMNIERILLDETQALQCGREYNAVFVRFPQTLKATEVHTLDVYYHGEPQTAKNPPWDGGFTWTTDQEGKPWVVVTCQGTGASLWWPNKDHQADEPDSMLISVTVPPGLTDISNGRLRRAVPQTDGWVRYEWFVSYPINNYNVTVNVGTFAHFSDTYVGADTVTLDYYVLPQNVSRAHEQFAQVKLMLRAYEHYFGPYPFPRDGYKLVESPHNGMEHQSAIAYGNRYLQGYRGRASSPVGLRFDFIIIHESAHEWWGNSVTAKDVADMWIHESFGAYAEGLYVEHLFGYHEAMTYVNAKKQNVRNAEPIIGVYNVQRPGSGDMYDKGQLVLNTLRHVIENDSLWFAIIKEIPRKFGYQSVTAEDVMGVVSEMSRRDLGPFFEQYFRRASLPTLDIQILEQGSSVTLRYRWRTDVENFAMPVRVSVTDTTFATIVPTTSWQTKRVDGLHPDHFRIADNEFYVNSSVRRAFLDPRLNQQ